MVGMTDCRPSDASVLELDRVRESLGLGVLDERVVRSIVIPRREEVMPLLGMEVPGFAIARFDMNVARAAHRDQWYSVVVKISVQVRVSRHSWCRVRLPEQIERGFGLRQQSVPQ